jgi:di/tricarboxylate transporter
MTAGARGPSSQNTRVPDDGTRQLLRWGGSILGTGVLAGVLLETVLGGFTRTGAHTNSGWFALILVLGCIPFGGMLSTLGIAKWLRNRRIARGR